jgi:pimeloyl-ACP methyl ester carboxylesterase
VHGGCHGAWCWESFLEYFPVHGYECHALSLRGHGGSDGRDRIRRISAAEYLADLTQVARGLRTPPVLIGHSIGAYLILKYLETHSAPAAILLAPVPVTGVGRMVVRQAIRHPWQALKMHLTWSVRALFDTPALAREGLFSADIPKATLDRHFARLQEDSYRAGADATFINLPRPRRVKPLPMLVLGAANDALFSRAETEVTARAYGTEAEFFPDMAHDMMLDRDWQKVAERSVEWLREKGL